jgi:predicted nucleic acid-binding protein
VKVFSNTTPFIALAAVDRLDLLPQLFGKVLVVENVVDECAAGGLIAVPPLRHLAWVELVETSVAVAPHLLLELDKGEKSTLLAAVEAKADLVSMDEKIGRNLAEYLGLPVMGTLGILLRARRQGMIASFRQTAILMQAQGIHFNSNLIDRLATTIGE